MIKGWIMSGDIAVASFHGRVVTPILPERCPLCFQKGGDLEAWLESRAIDRHRTNSRILKRILRLGDTSDLNTALHVHGATITDNYWVKTEDEANLTWADLRFYSGRLRSLWKSVPYCYQSSVPSRKSHLSRGSGAGRSSAYGGQR